MAQVWKPELEEDGVLMVVAGQHWEFEDLPGDELANLYVPINSHLILMGDYDDVCISLDMLSDDYEDLKLEIENLREEIKYLKGYD